MLFCTVVALCCFVRWRLYVVLYSVCVCSFVMCGCVCVCVCVVL